MTTGAIILLIGVCGLIGLAVAIIAESWNGS
jgi:hypothetical protein